MCNILFGWFTWECYYYFFVFFFFFKQKTAYEMRISDWSSDVCSSDLPFVTAAISIGTPVPKILALHILPNAVGALSVQATYVCAAAIITEAEIGRASCRERVCQYV